MLVGVKIKQPVEVLDYDFNYEEWFAGEADKIASAVVTVTPETMTVTAVVASDDVVKVWCRGGEDGETYAIELTATTDAGRVKQDEFELRVEDF